MGARRAPASASWVALYAWLGWLLWLQGIAAWRSLHTTLLVASIGLGVALALGWRAWMRESIGGGLHRRALSLVQLQVLEPGAFEAYVAEHLFSHRGYNAINTRDTKDGGVDVLATDRFGQTAVASATLSRHSRRSGGARPVRHDDARRRHLRLSGHDGRHQRRSAPLGAGQTHPTD